MTATAPLRIIHVLRAPVGGLFRHVIDLASGQSARGHAVGVVAASEGGAVAERTLDALATTLKLGVHRIPMRREVGLADAAAVRHVRRAIDALKPEIVHGHGAKGGAYARLAAPASTIRAYTPHGGSLHYGSRSPQGIIYGAVERWLMRRTDLFLFESAFARAAFTQKIGPPRSLVHVVPNGVRAEEFAPVATAPDARDLVTIGELRHIKGIDVLIDAVRRLHASGRSVTAAIVGAGPDEQALRRQVKDAGLDHAIAFAGYQPARTAFGMGRLLIVASRAESLPYIVLEAAAAGRPILATRVGGIPEIFGDGDALLPPGDPDALAAAIGAALDDPARAADAAGRLRDRVRAAYSQDAMVDGVLAAYRLAVTTKIGRSG